jgi:hypothetical protein
MRGCSWIFIIFLAAGEAAAQAIPDAPNWDFNLNIGAFGAVPGERAYPYNDWYTEGRYAASIGYYWTEHLKTEFEFAHTGEGSRYIVDHVPVPGTGAVHTIGIEAYHRVQQAAARVVWQFGNNTWVHPYVNAGYVFDAERRRYYSPPQYYYPGDPRTRPPIVVRPELNDRDHVYRSGISVGAGTKFYVSTNSYINAGLQWTYSRPARTLTALAGYGVEF